MRPLTTIAAFLFLLASAHARDIYVSSQAGDDANPGTLESPLKTLPKAVQLLAVTAGKTTDDLFLARGGTYDAPLPLVSGPSTDDLYTVNAYGSGPRPVVLCRIKRAVSAPPKSWQNARVSGLDFYGIGDDLQSGEPYAPVAPRIGATFERAAPVGNVEFTDCRSRFVEWIFQYPQGDGNGAVVLRRCVILDSYEANTLRQGLYTSGMGLLLDECVFDHNGWHETVPGAGAIIYNHNAYLSHARDTTVRNCLFLRASSIGLKFTANEVGAARNLIVDGNVFIEGEVGVSIGGNVSLAGRFVAPQVTNNAFLHLGRTVPTNRALGWGIEIRDWDGGECSGNIMLGQAPVVTNCFFISVMDAARGVLVKGNWCEGLAAGKGVIRLAGGAAQSGQFLENMIVVSEKIAIGAEVAPSGWTFTGNRWTKPTPDPIPDPDPMPDPDPVLVRFLVAGTEVDFAGFLAAMTAPMPPAPAPQVPRDITETDPYLGMPWATFLERARSQGNDGVWDETIMAPAINRRVREVFLKPAA